MKRILCFIIIICAFISATGCGYATQRKRNQYLNLYEKEENFVSLTGKVTEVDNGENAQILKIECPDLLNYVSQKAKRPPKTDSTMPTIMITIATVMIFLPIF